MMPGMSQMPFQPAAKPHFVNAKQYHRILKRRAARSKLNSDIKAFKSMEDKKVFCDGRGWV
jgi:hypothetical protein